ncbi:MAG: FAD-dependent oxidoreductase, partial [Acidobacteriota bacterium]
RPFLRIGALAGASLFARTLSASPLDAATSPPVVIVGAGLAGLHAAMLLRRAGRGVLVLEARPTVGGRVQTIRRPFGDDLFGEAGPIRIASLHTTVLGLVGEHGLDLVPFSSANGAEVLTHGRRTVRADARARTDALFGLRADERGLTQGALIKKYVGELAASLTTLDPSPATYASWEPLDRVTWPAWLAARGASPGAIRLMTIGGDSRALSALYVLRQYALLQGNQAYYKIGGGMDLLPRRMAAALGDIVRCNVPVVRIDQSTDPIRVDYLEQDALTSVSASRVIVTTPLSTLRDVDIRPALSSAKQHAVRTLPYFAAARVLLETRSRFWHRSGLSGYARTDQPAEIWDAAYDIPVAAGLLAATIGGVTASRFLALPPEAALARGRALAAVPFPGLPTEFRRGVVHQWGLERWSRGAFAVFHPGQMTGMMPDIVRPEGRIHFAGEHTSAWMGWMEGALQSGARAVQEVLG